MKIALCYSGNFRTFNECFENHYSIFNHPEDEVDVYFSTWKQLEFVEKINDNWHRKSEMRLSHKEVTEELINSIINDRFKVKAIHISDITQTSFIPPAPYYHGLMCQYYQIDKCNQLLKYQKEQYDVIIRIRPDVIINSFDRNILIDVAKNDFMYFNYMTWFNYPFDKTCINEMIWIAKPELMDKCCRIYNNFHNIHSGLQTCGVQTYGEKVCYENLKLEGITDRLKIFNFNYNVIR